MFTDFSGTYTYNEIPMSDNVTGDLNIFPLVAEAGICYHF